MNKNIKMVGLLSTMIIMAGLTVLGGNYSTVEVATTPVEIPADTPYFKSMILEPIVIEKEVIVYKEAEPEIIYIEKEPEPAAEPEIIDQAITADYDIFRPTNMTVTDVINALGESRAGLHDVAQAFVDAEQVYGINALYFMATIGLESGWGRHESGYNNIAGWKGNRGSWSNFDSRYECLMTVAEGLSTSFREDVGGRLADVTARYCPEPDYLSKIQTIMGNLRDNLY